MSKKALAIKRYLENECSDYWHVKEEKGIIKCFFIDKLRFSITKEDGDWYISGKEIPLDIASEIFNILYT